MCMGNAPIINSKNERKLIAVAILLSPILLPVCIVGGIAWGAATAASAAADAIKQHHRQGGAVASLSNRLKVVVDSDELAAALQAAYDKTLASPSFASFAELATCLVFKRDYPGAHMFFVKAEHFLGRRGEAAVPAWERAAAMFCHGLTLQGMARFSDSARYFDRAADLLTESGAVFPEGAPAAIDRNDALLQSAYSTYLNFMFLKYDTTLGGEYYARSHRQDVLRPALEKIDIVVAAEPSNLQAKLIRAYVEYQMYLPNVTYGTPEPQPYNTPFLLLAHADCKAVFDWVRAAAPEEAEVQGILQSDVDTLMGNILLAMGQRTEALPLIEEWMREPSQRATDDASLRQLLLTPLPLPRGLVVDTTSDKHLFAKHLFKSPTYCDWCTHLITPMQNLEGAYRCATCRYEVHGSCLEAAQSQYCLATRDVGPRAESITHTHIFITHRMHRVRRCCICDESIMFATTGGQCQTCNQYAHKKCIENTNALSSPKV